MTCNGCMHAKWVRTASGRLHPSGDGMCGYPYKLPELPASMCWVTMYKDHDKEPEPRMGRINRKKDLPKDCVYYLEYV